LLYIVLFEFTWVNQSFIPKPSVVLDSFFSLWSEYNLFGALVETTLIIFPVMFIQVLFFDVAVKYLLLLLDKYNGIINISIPFKYFSFFVFALIFNLVFESSFIGELVFAILFVFGQLLNSLNSARLKISGEYIDSAKSLGLSDNKIISKVIWPNIKPKFYSNLSSLHLQLWSVILIYEFVGGIVGIGSIYRLAYIYNDLVAIFALAIFVSLILLFVNSLIKYFISKLIFWQ
jgi:ABC-type nitrate/sulfonate/bicarbonate transport system permease component